jgi:hypothetical protein
MKNSRIGTQDKTSRIGIWDKISRIRNTEFNLTIFLFRNLCDMNQEGKLNPEQFALAMYLVQQKQAGKDPPAALTPDMVPPSMRPKGGAAAEASKSVYNNPELEAMAR